MNDEKCQIMTLGGMSEPLSSYQKKWQRIKNLKWTFGRRINYLQNWIAELQGKRDKKYHNKDFKSSSILKAGDMVRVKSEMEIRKTLNRWNKLKGCGVMDDMWQYCGTEQKVLKEVRQFLDERDYLMKKCKGVVVLEGVICEGTPWFGACDRSCHFFWREEWLEKVN